jgi:hypothetical protein
MEAQLRNTLRPTVSLTPRPTETTILPPGTYELFATARDGVTGPYRIQATRRGTEPQTCFHTIFLTPGVFTNGTLTDSDCLAGNFADLDPLNSVRYADRYMLWMKAGTTYQISLSSSEFDPVIRLFTESLSRIASDDDSGPGNSARLTYSVPSDRVVVVEVSAMFRATGFYSLNVVSQ